ncbi:hypothetical protein ACFQ7U_21445, partial [Streptomyces rubiginosohelvolus]
GDRRIEGVVDAGEEGLRGLSVGGGWGSALLFLFPPRDGVVMTVASFDLTDGRVTRVWAVRNPEKLRPWARHDMS